MKNFKIYLAALLLLLIPALQSCDSNDEETSSYSLVTLRVIEGSNYYFELGSGKKILPADTTSIHNYVLKDGQRAIIGYNALDQQVEGYDLSVKLHWIDDVLTKNIIPLTPLTADSIGDDHVRIRELWIENNYLNIEFQMMGFSYAKPHMLNLVANETPEKPDADYVNLEFRHNMNGDSPTHLSYPSLVCFKLDTLTPEEILLKGINLRVKTLSDGVKFYKIDFKKGEASTVTAAKARELTLTEIK